MTFINVFLLPEHICVVRPLILRVFRFREAFWGSFADLRSIPANPHRFQFSLQGMIDLFNDEQEQANALSLEDIDRSLER